MNNMDIKLGKKFGDWINKYLKNYGCYWFETPDFMFHWWGKQWRFWPRRWIVYFLCCALSRIDREEFENCKITYKNL